MVGDGRDCTRRAAGLSFPHFHGCLVGVCFKMCRKQQQQQQQQQQQELRRSGSWVFVGSGRKSWSLTDIPGVRLPESSVGINDVVTYVLYVAELHSSEQLDLTFNDV